MLLLVVNTKATFYHLIQSIQTKTTAHSIGPLYFFFVTMLRHNSPQSAEALAALNTSSDIIDILLTEAIYNARSMALRDPAQGTVPRVPAAFSASNMDVLVQRIDETFSSRAFGHIWALDAHRALALWRSGNR